MPSLLVTNTMGLEMELSPATASPAGEKSCELEIEGWALLLGSSSCCCSVRFRLRSTSWRPVGMALFTEPDDVVMAETRERERERQCLVSVGL